MVRARLVLFIVLTLLVVGVSGALAQEAPPSGPAEAPGEPDCAAEACEAPAEELEAEESESAEQDSTVEPAEEDIPAETEPVEEAESAQDPTGVTVSTAQRAALALADASVDVIDSDYSPGSVSINAGDTVTWTQSGEQPHTVTADDGTFDSGEMGAGDTFSMRFDSPGTYRYYCTFHGGPGGQGMSAVVIVEGGQASEDPPSVDPGDEGNGNGTGQADDETVAPSGSNGSLPRTGGGPPPVWVFALALGISGVVLWKVARLTEVADHS